MAEQRAALIELGCPLGQGHYFARALPAERHRPDLLAAASLVPAHSRLRRRRQPLCRATIVAGAMASAPQAATSYQLHADRARSVVAVLTAAVRLVWSRHGRSRTEQLGGLLRVRGARASLLELLLVSAPARDRSWRRPGVAAVGGRSGRATAT